MKARLHRAKRRLRELSSEAKVSASGLNRRLQPLQVSQINWKRGSIAIGALSLLPVAAGIWLVVDPGALRQMIDIILSTVSAFSG